MTDKLKELVSKKKRRFKQDGYNLDLAYIKPNIVAMGFPADSMEAIYRNNIEDVHKFFEEKHANHYKIYNLCKEKQRKYDTKRFPKIAHYPFEDHNAPPFQLIKPFCEDVADFLAESEENVAVIHCKAGKGRTGVMIASYLLHEGIYQSVRQALQFYGEARTFDMKGVTIPSQRRYVYYYGDLVMKDMKYEAKTLLLTKIRLIKLPFTQAGSLTISFSISILYVKSYSSPYEEVRRDLDYKDLYPDKPTPVCGDIKIEIFTKQLTKERLCQFWLNSFFISKRTKTSEESDSDIDGKDENSFIVTLTKAEIDKINKDKKHKIVPPDFKIEIHFEDCTNDPHHMPSSHLSNSSNSDPESDTDLEEDENSEHIYQGRPTPV